MTNPKPIDISHILGDIENILGSPSSGISDQERYNLMAYLKAGKADFLAFLALPVLVKLLRDYQEHRRSAEGSGFLARPFTTHQQKQH
jgi:hypothetical protein